MDLSTKTEVTMALMVCQEREASSCLSVKATTRDVDPTEIDEAESTCTYCGLSMQLVFGYDSLLVEIPATKKAPPRKLIVRFGVSMVDLRLMLAGMYAPYEYRSHNEPLNLESKSEDERRADRTEDRRESQQAKVEAGFKRWFPFLGGEAKASTEEGGGSRQSNSQKTSSKEFDAYTYGGKLNPRWLIRGNLDDAPLERGLVCETILKLSDSPQLSEIEARTFPGRIEVDVHPTDSGPVKPDDVMIAKRATERALGDLVLYRAQLSPT